MVHFEIGKSVVVWILCSTVESLSELERITATGQLAAILTGLFNSFKVSTADLKIEVGDLQDELEGIKKCFWSTDEGIVEISRIRATVNSFSAINGEQFKSHRHSLETRNQNREAP